MIFKFKKLIGILKSPLFLNALSKGAAAGVEHKVILKNMAKCNCVVDVGANRGQFALVARYCFPNARIDSFEPLNEPAIIFERVFEHDRNTKLHHYAVGSEKGDTIIHISSRDDSSSLLPIAEGQVSLFPETLEKETRIIQVVPLDQVFSEEDILSPALLKIDIQGYELTTLQGCGRLLYRFDYVYVECSFVELYEGQALADEVIKFLAGYQFSLAGIYNIFYNQEGKAIQADFLFERNEDN